MQKITFETDVYTFHIDYAGHVSNIVYIQWMEIGRTKLIEVAGMPVERLVEEGIFPILAGTQIEYRSPLYLGDRVRVELWLSELRRASATIEFRFYNQDGVLAASGSQKGLFLQRETKRPHRLSPARRAAFEAFLETSPG